MNKMSGIRIRKELILVYQVSATDVESNVSSRFRLRLANQPSSESVAWLNGQTATLFEGGRDEVDDYNSAPSDVQPVSFLDTEAENFLSLLTVQVAAFAVCEIGEGYALAVPAKDAIVVHFVLSGSGAIEWEGHRLELEQGSIAIAPRGLAKRLAGPGAVNTIIAADADADADCVTGSGLLRFQTADPGPDSLRLACATISANVGMGFGLFDQLRTPLTREGGEKLSTLFAWLLKEIARPAFGGKSLIETYMKQILVMLMRDLGGEGERMNYLSSGIVDRSIALVINAVIADPSKNHSLANLANIAGVSPTCLNQKFKGLIGLTPGEYVQKIRMDTARNLLLTTRLPVKCIAAAVGFASRSHFSREFTKLVGQDPTRFRHAQPQPQPHLRVVGSDHGSQPVQFSMAGQAYGPTGPRPQPSNRKPPSDRRELA